MALPEVTSSTVVIEICTTYGLPALMICSKNNFSRLTECTRSIFAILKFKRAHLKFTVRSLTQALIAWTALSTQDDVYTTSVSHWGEPERALH